VTDRRARQLAERNLGISEASRRIADDLKATEPDVPWQDIAGIGNVLRLTPGPEFPANLGYCRRRKTMLLPPARLLALLER
jgi:hypothetical protein